MTTDASEPQDLRPDDSSGNAEPSVPQPSVPQPSVPEPSVVEPTPAPDPDPWANVEFVAPQPLAGVTGVTGPELAAGLRCDPSSLTPAQLVEQLTGAERLIRWGQSVQLAAIAELALYASPDHPQFDPVPELGSSARCRAHQSIDCQQCLVGEAATATAPGVPDRGQPRMVEVGFATPERVGEFLSDGISAALSISISAANQLVGAALCARDSKVITELMQTGQIDVARVKVLERQFAPISTRPGAVEAAAELALEFGALTVKKFRDKVTERVLSVIGEDRAHLAERSRRRIWFSPDDAGMATLGVYLPAEDARLAFDTLTSLAYRQHADAEAAEGPCQSRADAEEALCVSHGGVRSLDNLRADAFMGWIWATHNDLIDPATGMFDDTVGDPTRHRRRAKPNDVSRVMLHLHMNASTLADVDDHAAHLMGYGPISADHARRICENATLIRILTDPVTNKVVAMDTPSYKIPKILRWSVTSRDGYCIFPTCERPAHTGEIDHRDPHPGGRNTTGNANRAATGITAFDNLGSACTRHHRMKTHAGWTIHDCGDGWIEWESPTGHRYHRGPEFIPRTIMHSPEGRALQRKRSGPWYNSIPPKAPLDEGSEGGSAAVRKAKDSSEPCRPLSDRSPSDSDPPERRLGPMSRHAFAARADSTATAGPPPAQQERRAAESHSGDNTRDEPPPF